MRSQEDSRGDARRRRNGKERRGFREWCKTETVACSEELAVHVLSSDCLGCVQRVSICCVVLAFFIRFTTGLPGE